MDYRERINRAKEAMMMVRRANLEALVKNYGSIKALAIAVSRPATQIGDMVRGPKPIGEKITRHIEKELGLGEFALDRNNNKDSTAEESNVLPLTFEENKTTRVPLISAVQAGCPTDHGDPCYDEYVDVYGNLADGCYALRVSGDSMSPLMDNGDIVVVDPHRWPKPGDCIVARSELESLSEATVKRYYPVGFDEDGREVFEARPLNEMYPTMHSVKQKLQIIGTICKLLKDL